MPFCLNRKLFFVKLLLAMCRFRGKRVNETALAVGNKLSKYLTDKISDKTFNCHVNIVLLVYKEWLG